MPFDLTPLDLLALGCFAGTWALHGLLVDRHLSGLKSLNRRMHQVRRAWMRNMLLRENRMMDSMLLGHLIGSASFFASTSVLLLAGLLGVLAAADDAHRVVTELGFTVATSRHLFELKVLLQIAVFILAFFNFTWSLRQFNYTVALLGASPVGIGRPVADAETAGTVRVDAATAEQLADEAATVLSLSVRSFNGGLRCYYYALASLGWLAGPVPFMAFTLGVFALLLWRQFVSGTARTVAVFSGIVAPRGGGPTLPA